MQPPLDREWRAILIPYNAREACSTNEAARLSGKSQRRIRELCVERGIGRRLFDGQWAVSRVALAMLLDGDEQALKSYQDGLRAGSVVETYYARLGLGDLIRPTEARVADA